MKVARINIQTFISIIILQGFKENPTMEDPKMKEASNYW